MWKSNGLFALEDNVIPTAPSIVDSRIIPDISIANAGLYNCSAFVSYNGPNAAYVTNSNISTPSTATVNVTIRQPTVSVSSVIVTSGSSAVLDCMVTVASQDVQGVSLVDADVTWNSIVQVPPSLTNNVFTSQYIINDVSADDATEYTCNAIISANNGNENVIPSPAGSGFGTLYVTELSFFTNVTVRLDTEPFNTFLTNCSLTYNPDTPTVNATFSLSDNNTMDSISNIGKSSDNIISELNEVSINDAAAPNSIEQYVYTCSVTVTVDNVSPLMDSDSVIITVRGPADPVAPQLLDPTNITSTGATVRWTISRVTYTPETYTVYYGLSPSSLNLSSSSTISSGVDNETFLTTNNQPYQQGINNLNSNQKYYYLVNSSNTVGSNVSVVNNFTTAEAAPSAPENVAVFTSSASSLTLEWEQPSMPNGQILNYTYTCTSTNSSMVNTSVGQVAGSSRMATVTNLKPFIEYECSVRASTSAGTGEAGTATGVTGEAAPSGSPTDFFVTSDNNNPRQLALSWMAPNLEDRNGNIIQYNVNCTNVDNNTVHSDSTMLTRYTFTNLFVFTNYLCSVTAATIVGSGPAAIITNKTGEAEPSRVENLMSNGLNASTLYISWDQPVRLNGIILRYIVTISSYTDGSLIHKIYTNTTEIRVTNRTLERGVPYNINASAETGGGEGPSVMVVNFTEEGTPATVQDVKAVRINDGTAMNVSWTPLTIIEAQGFFKYYVTATPDNGARRRQSPRTEIFNSSVSSGIVGGLEGSVTYIVTVTVQNNANSGSPSLGISVTPIPAESSSSPIAVIIGVVIGGLVILILLTVVVILLMFVLRRMGHSKQAEIHENPLTVDLKEQNENGTELKLLSVKQDQEFNERIQAVAIDDFADHVRQLHMNRDLGFEEEYESLKSIPIGSFTVAKMQNNIPRNRFDNVYSYDDSRVVLPTNDGGTDYINASFIGGYKRPKAYIAAQGPLVNTVVDFWRMVWEFQLPTIVMLTELVERGIEKCTCYYPRNNNETIDVGGGLKVTLIEQQQFVEYKYKKFLLLNTNAEGGRLDVTHYHFLAWPDHGVPADKTVMMAFARRVRQTHPPEGPPLIVHCSAGVGRTGTFIVLDTMMQRIEKKEGSLNIYELVAEMRSCRTLMVQTAAQYIYTHDALSEYIICGDTSITTKGLRDKMNELSKVSGGESGYQKQLALLDKISRAPSEGHCSDSLSKQNVVKNRYSQVISSLPYNETRVRLRTTSGVGDYINASIVDGYKHKGAFLATQAPLDATTADLWRMIWENWSASIVMLCTVDEEETMHCYWPKAIDEKCVYGMIEVKLVSEKEEKGFFVRKFELSQESNYVNLATGNADKLVVTQYHYHQWPIDGKPTNSASLLELINQLLKTQKLSGNKAITVMCNDGIDRTGSFICLYSQLERVKVEGIADVFQFIKGSRFHRPGLVQNVVNYIFCHEILLEFLNSFDQYENFK